MNQSGVQDDWEYGIPYAEVRLLDAAGQTALGTATADADGRYLFTDLAPGTYQLEFVLPVGYVFTYPGVAGSTEQNDSDANRGTGKTGPITLLAGQVDDRWDAGIFAPSQESSGLGGLVWQDGNADGGWDAGEPLLANVQLALLSSDGVLRSATTDANGRYNFPNLAGGQDYTVTVDTATLPPGMAPSFDPDGIQTANIATGYLLPTQIRIDFDFGYVPSAPGFVVVKTASQPIAAPGEAVTYQYAATLTGSQPISYLQIVDDNATPDYLGDDFSPEALKCGPANAGDVNFDGMLNAGEVWMYVATLVPPVSMRDIVNGQNIEVGKLITQTLATGDIRVTYIQSTGLNDNSYGVNTVGWTRDHKFGDLTGAEKVQFRFTDRTGRVVLDMNLDYITASSSVASGYTTLGPFGGDGKLIKGLREHVLSYSTSLSDNFNRAGLGVHRGVASNGFNLTQNSPQTAGGQSYDVVDAFFGNWEFRSIYQVTVSKNAFGTAGFGDVSVPLGVNSPPKTGTANNVYPKASNSVSTNRVVMGGQAGPEWVTAVDEAVVEVFVNSTPDNGVTAGPLQFNSNTVKFTLTNGGSQSVNIGQIVAFWPSLVNGKLKKIKVGGDVIYDTDTRGSSAEITRFKGPADLRKLSGGQTVTMTFEFEKSVNRDPANYGFSIGFVEGGIVTV